MRYGIPLLGNRVAPRCTFADEVMVVVLRRREVRREESLALPSHSLMDLIDLLAKYRIDTLVCGGISRQNREFLEARSVNIIDNVSCTLDELMSAIRRGVLQPGLGFGRARRDPPELATPGQPAGGDPTAAETCDRSPAGQHEMPLIDCLACADRVCLRGDHCPLAADTGPAGAEITADFAQMLDATMDVAFEDERTLCRLSELIYFCLEMKYERLGIAYCTELEEPADILVRVLRRFFDVRPVCCKIGGRRANDPIGASDGPSVIACNPVGQAEALNRMDTDLNVMVGMCMGADCVFAQASEAPVTTLFVKDKSLANNPIGAVYSDFYLKEVTGTLPREH